MKTFFFFFIFLFSFAFVAQAQQPTGTAQPVAVSEPAVVLPKFLEQFITSFCSRSIECGDKIDLATCTNVLRDTFPVSQLPQLEAIKSKFEDCSVAVKKTACDSLKKEPPLACKFLDEVNQ